MMLTPSPMSGLIASSPARLPNAWTHGMGDWFDPSCEPGTEGCVPHAYCYVPFMATPDCLKSFAQGVKKIAGGTAQAAGGVVGAAVKGAVTGAVEGATGGGDGDKPGGLFSAGTLLIAGAVGLGALIFFGSRR